MVRVMSLVTDRPFVVAAVALLAVVSILLSSRLTARLSCRRTAAALLLLAGSAPFVLTLLPNPSSGLLPSAGTGGGPLSRACSGLVRLPAQWGARGEEPANLLLLVPLTVLAVLLLDRRAAAVVVVLAVLFPFAVETVQYSLPRLNRQCDATDLVLNLTGVGLGSATGLLLRGLGLRRHLLRPGVER